MRHARAGEPPFDPQPLRSHHAAGLARLHAALLPPGWPEHDFRGFLADKAVFGFGFCGPAMTGMILCRTAADDAEVLTFGVAPPRRRRGAGRALLALAMAEAARRGARNMYLEVAEHNLPARALYEGAGFFAVGRRARYYISGFDGSGADSTALVLRKTLCDLKSHPASDNANFPESG